MLPIRTILHPTDFSSRAEAAFRVAAALARDYKARLLVAHVLEYETPVVGEFGVMPVVTEDPHDVIENKLAKIQAGPDIVTERLFLEGDPVSEIIELATSRDVDVIVLGTHGRTGLSRLLMGSTAEMVVRRAPCMVLTVKAPPLHREVESAEAGEQVLHEEAV